MDYPDRHHYNFGQLLFIGAKSDKSEQLEICAHRQGFPRALGILSHYL